MKRVWVPLCPALAGMLLIFAGCFQEVERLGVATVMPPTLVATSTPVTVPSDTPVPTSVPIPVVTIIPIATPTPEIPPTATPRPTATLSPSDTPLPPPTSPAVTPEPTVVPTPPLFLQVRTPENGSEVPSDAVVVHGVASLGAQVTINGEAVTVGQDGGFRGEAALSPGVNQIEVVATDALGSRRVQVLTVTSLALPTLPFMLLITEPADQSIVLSSIIRLSGRTGPEAVVSVNGVSLRLDVLGIFSTRVTLEPGPNIIDVVATNNDGQIMSAVIAVIFRP